MSIVVNSTQTSAQPRRVVQLVLQAGLCRLEVGRQCFLGLAEVVDGDGILLRRMEGLCEPLSPANKAHTRRTHLLLLMLQCPEGCQEGFSCQSRRIAQVVLFQLARWRWTLRAAQRLPCARRGLHGPLDVEVVEKGNSSKHSANMDSARR
jgi:hypothetical protein